MILALVSLFPVISTPVILMYGVSSVSGTWIEPFLFCANIVNGKPVAQITNTAAVSIAGERVAVNVPAGEAAPLAPAPTREPAPGSTRPTNADRSAAREAGSGRSGGDKGNISNIGVIARRPEWLPLLWQRVTPDAVQRHFSHLVKGRVERFLLPGIDAMNFMLHDALGGGGPASARFDPLGKGMAQILLDMPVAVPASLAARL